MSTHTFIPIHIHITGPQGTATLDTFVGYMDEAVKFMVQGVSPGDRTSGPMSLRRVGATLAAMDAP